VSAGPGQLEREERQADLARARQAQVEGLQTALTGVGVGAIGAVGAAVMGAACPACALVTPVLLGVGVLQGARGTWLRRKAERPLAEAAVPAQR